MTMATLIKENIYVGLVYIRFSPLSSWRAAWHHAGRCSAEQLLIGLQLPWAAGREKATGHNLDF